MTYRLNTRSVQSVHSANSSSCSSVSSACRSLKTSSPGGCPGMGSLCTTGEELRLVVGAVHAE